MDAEDQRDVELSALSAIFPEIQRLTEDDPYIFTLDIPVNATKTVTVYFPAAGTGHLTSPAVSQATLEAAHDPPRIDSHELSYLPAVHLQISLPPAYPAEQPPAVHVSTTPSWLPLETARKLEDDCVRLWEELGRDLVVFTYVDHVQQSAEDVFGLVDDSGTLEISPEHKIAILDFDIGAKRAAFEKQTFECGVCLDPKKGAKCHRMLDCGHVFCVECLQDFYSNAITEGDIATVRCLQPNCAKERESVRPTGGKKPKKSKTSISPSELLQIPLEPEMVKRYVALKYKTELESDKNTVYCPRSWCQGAARSKKRRKPQGFELHETENDSDEETKDETEGPVQTSKQGVQPYQPEDRLAVCEDCHFAFCSRCRQSWHGEFVVCAPPRDSQELSQEEKASLEFIDLHTTPCPTCGCPAQKTHGCNHMTCFKCQTHFCYLCSAWLDPGNPYQHYNRLPNGGITGCYMRLWELEEGDEDGGNAFAGRRNYAGAVPVQAPEAEDVLQAAFEAEAQRMQRQRRAEAEGNRVLLNGPVNLVPEGPRVFRLDVAAPQGNPNDQQQAAAEPLARRPPQQARAGQERDRGHAREARQQQPRAQAQRQQQPEPRRRDGRRRGVGNRLQNHEERGGQAIARRERHFHEQVQDDAGVQDQLEDMDAAWVRQFVHLALEDNEHLLDEDD